MVIERVRELYDNVNFPLSALEALQVPREQYTLIPSRVLLQCFPDCITLMYAQRAKNFGQGSTTGSVAESLGSKGQACQ